MVGNINGKFHVWNLLGNSRSYADIHLPYAEAAQYVMPVRYNASSGKGEQRALFDAHVKKLKSEMLNGNFTPTQLSAGLHERHKSKLVLDQTNRTFTLEVDSDDPLAQTDGGHRYGAIELILKEYRERLKKTEGDEEKAQIQADINSILALEIGIRVFFDGNLKTDFINLQSGRPVDPAHMLALKIQQRLLSEPEYKLGFEVCRQLNKTKGSPFEGIIRLDSRIAANSLLKQMPFNSLMALSSSDLSTSILGLARVAHTFGSNAEFITDCVLKATEAVTTMAPSLCEEGKVLTPPRSGGTKGSATMLIGLGVCLAYRVLSQGRTEVTQDDLTRLAASAQVTLDMLVAGNFSGGMKRTLMGAFARNYLADLTGETHDGLPKGLLRILSASAFGAQSLPKEPKPAPQASRKKKDKETLSAPAQPVDDADVTTESLDAQTQTADAPWNEQETVPVAAATEEPWQEIQG